jgi:hypothetical protein
MTGDGDGNNNADDYLNNYPIDCSSDSRHRTYLGCYNNRREQLRRLARALALRKTG